MDITLEKLLYRFEQDPSYSLIVNKGFATISYILLIHTIGEHITQNNALYCITQ